MFHEVAFSDERKAAEEPETSQADEEKKKIHPSQNMTKLDLNGE